MVESQKVASRRAPGRLGREGFRRLDIAGTVAGADCREAPAKLLKTLYACL
jgi:hypothetical protein